MTSPADEIRVYKLTPEEVEQLLSSRFGRKIEPVDKVALSRLKQVQEKQEAWRLAFQAGLHKR